MRNRFWGVKEITNPKEKPLLPKSIHQKRTNCCQRFSPNCNGCPALEPPQHLQVFWGHPRHHLHHPFSRQAHPSDSRFPQASRISCDAQASNDETSICVPEYWWEGAKNSILEHIGTMTWDWTTPL